MFKNYNKTMFILIGIQASGKTTFCQKYYSGCSIISLDTVKTRKKESMAIVEAIKTGNNLVIDNTNPTVAERKKYIDIAEQNEYKVVGIYFRSSLEECFTRNSKRKNAVPIKGILSTAKKLEQPSYTEKFNELYYVKIEDNEFIVSKWDENYEI